MQGVEKVGVVLSTTDLLNTLNIDMIETGDTILKALTKGMRVWRASVCNMF